MRADEELNLHQLLSILRKRRQTAALGFALCLSAATAYNYLRPELFTADAAVTIEPSALGPLGRAIDIKTELPTHVEIISSSDFSLKVASRLGRDKMTPSYSAVFSAKTNFILLSARAGTGPEALRLVETVIAVYIERDMEVRTRNARKTLEDLEARQRSTGEMLRPLEESRQAFLEKYKETRMNTPFGSLILDLQTRRQELLRKFTPEHPDVVAINARLNTLEKGFSSQPAQDKELSRLNRGVRINEDLYSALTRQMEEARSALATITSPITVVSPPILRDLPGLKTWDYALWVLGAAIAALLAAYIKDGLDFSLSSVDDVEKLLGLPVLAVVPRWSSPVTGGLLARIGLRRRLPSRTRHLIALRNPQQAERIEIYHRLRASLLVHLEKREPLVMTFTSASVGEGKSLTATNFALACANMGLKTLLVGADSQRGTLHKTFGLPRTPGLSEILGGDLSWDTVLRPNKRFLRGSLLLEDLVSFEGLENLTVIAEPADVHRFREVLTEPNIERWIGEIRRRFSVIAIDCPPVLLSGEVLLFARHSDATVVVYRAGRLPQSTLRLACEHLRASKAKVLGIVLNDVPLGDVDWEYRYYSNRRQDNLDSDS